MKSCVFTDVDSYVNTIRIYISGHRIVQVKDVSNIYI